MDFLLEYGLFLAKVITVALSLVVVLGLLINLGGRIRKQEGVLEVEKINDTIEQLGNAVQTAMLGSTERKKLAKQKKKEAKDRLKQVSEKTRVFLLAFKGDLRASAVASLREEITAVLSQAKPEDEVVVLLESAGGMVHSYGLAASQLDRIKKRGIPLTVCVDKIAASGGYMMACVADKILAAPFSMIGSIGVVAQLPNFNRLLKKHDVDVELHTAGEFKRTLTMFGENTDEGREKFIEDIQEIHDLFKNFVGSHRKDLDIDKIATGQVWLGTRALEESLVDELMTSDEYLVDRSNQADIYQVSYLHHKSLPEKLGLAAENRVDNLLLRWWNRLCNSRYSV
ncbi:MULTISPECIES: protease SohB [Porticoccus]|uniref:protease SohB n=1 Tax=Porticoccus TaxID=1123967 RepID=UPI000564F582|nr:MULTISPECIES: protease SohB [Porticoccus]MAZ70990.1 protease SohB [Porticoccus sp.]